MRVTVRPQGSASNMAAMEGKPQRKRATMDERRQLRKARRRGWRAPQLRNPAHGCCDKRARPLFNIINVAFIILGIVIILLGIWGATSVWAEFVGTGPGFMVVGLGVAVVVTALCGLIGAKRDNKCLLLIYFMVLSFSFVCMAVMGGIAFFNNSQFNTKFSGWWDKYPDAAARGQSEFGCCGYQNVTDRPAGNCSLIVPTPTVGCKEKGLEYMRTKFVPLFICAFVFGLAQFLAIIFSMKLLCKSTFKNPLPANGMKGADKWNSYDPGANALEGITLMPVGEAKSTDDGI